jgi:hypothetical protein
MVYNCNIPLKDQMGKGSLVQLMEGLLLRVQSARSFRHVDLATITWTAPYKLKAEAGY